MPIVSAAIVPNLTLLAPGVGQENILAYKQTVSAYQELADRLAKEHVETVVIISNRGIRPEMGLAINLHHEFQINFEAFGDLTTKLSVASDLALIDHIKNNLDKDLPLSLASINPLDYGSAVPLVYLLPVMPKLKIVTIYPSTQSLYKQSEIGVELARVLHSYQGAVAVLASVNLSSRLLASPLGYLPKAKGYDKKIINAFETDDYRFLYNFEAEEEAEYYEQGLSPLACFAGVISSFKKKVELTSYEHPQGLGAAILELEF